MVVSNEEYAQMYERACAIYDALVADLPHDEPEGDMLIDVGEVSGALSVVCRDYEQLKQRPSTSVLSELKSLNEDHPSSDTIAVEERLAGIS